MIQKEILKNLITEDNKIRGIEIGTLEGDTVMYLLKEISNLRMITIDPEPLYEQVKKDIENYLPLVKSGGFIGGHDYDSPAYTDVKRAVDEIFKDKKINVGEDYTWWVYV